MIDNRDYDTWWEQIKIDESKDNEKFEAGHDEWRITYWKLIIYTCLPVLSGVSSISVWWIYLTYKNWGR